MPGGTPVQLTQVQFRARGDTVGLNVDTWDHALNANFAVASGTPFRVRFTIAETAGGMANNVAYSLQFNREGAGFVNVGLDTAVRLVESSHFDHLDPTTQVISSGSFVAGVGVTETTTTNISLQSQRTEIEWCLQLVGVDDEDQSVLRVVQGGDTVLNIYSNSPTITAIVEAGSPSGGSTAATQVAAFGGGHKVAEGGDLAAISVSALGGGLKSTEGGSVSVVLIDATGGGKAVSESEGGSTTAVQVAAQGGGQKIAQGGSGALNNVVALGGGTKVSEGGDDAAVLIGATGGGKAVSDGIEGGSTAAVQVSAQGGGQKSAEGGSVAVSNVVAFGVGLKLSEGGGDATVIVGVTGGGEATGGSKVASGGSQAITQVISSAGGVKSARGGGLTMLVSTVQGGGIKYGMGGSNSLVLIRAFGPSTVEPRKTGSGIINYRRRRRG